MRPNCGSNDRRHWYIRRPGPGPQLRLCVRRMTISHAPRRRTGPDPRTQRIAVWPSPRGRPWPSIDGGARHRLPQFAYQLQGFCRGPFGSSWAAVEPGAPNHGKALQEQVSQRRCARALTIRCSQAWLRSTLTGCGDQFRTPRRQIVRLCLAGTPPEKSQHGRVVTKSARPVAGANGAGLALPEIPLEGALRNGLRQK